MGTYSEQEISTLRQIENEDRFVKRRIELLATNEEKAEVVKSFIEKAKEASQLIGDPDDRDSLRALLRAWNAHLFDLIGEYVDIELLEYVRDDKDLYEDLVAEGRKLFDLQDFEGAEGRYVEALGYKPGGRRASWGLLGVVHKFLFNEPDKAIELISLVIEDGQKSSISDYLGTAYYYLGRAYEQKGNWREAEKAHIEAKKRGYRKESIDRALGRILIPDTFSEMCHILGQVEPKRVS